LENLQKTGGSFCYGAFLHVDIIAIQYDHNFVNAKIGIAEAKSGFEKIVSRASAGEVITLTKHGQPAAQIVPVQNHRQRLGAEWRQRVKKIRLNRSGQPKITIRQLIEEGRK
jgi:prevent-host-death family protein